MVDNVSTSMDQLVGLLEKGGTIKISDASRELGTDKEHVEGWAKMLEKAGIVNIHYSVVGGALLKRGPKFDTVVRAPASPPRQLPAPPAVATTPKPALATVTSRPAPMAVPPRPAPAESSSPAPKFSGQPGEYLLIRRKIEEEQKTIADDLQKLKQEQALVVRYMDEIEAEESKLSDYVDALRVAVDKMNQKVEVAAQGK